MCLFDAASLVQHRKYPRGEMLGAVHEATLGVTVCQFFGNRLGARDARIRVRVRVRVRSATDWERKMPES